MFSTVDARHLVAWRLTQEGWARVGLPDGLADAAERAEALPTAARLRRLAGDVARTEPGAPALRVEVWETRFGPGMRPAPRRLAVEELGPGGAR
jgi:ferric-dicitrate binding protein FerR (iron transport regulator)